MPPKKPVPAKAPVKPVAKAPVKPAGRGGPVGRGAPAGRGGPVKKGPVQQQGMSCRRKRGSSVVSHLPLVLEVPGSILAHEEEKISV